MNLRKELIEISGGVKEKERLYFGWKKGIEKSVSIYVSEKTKT